MKYFLITLVLLQACNNHQKDAVDLSFKKNDSLTKEINDLKGTVNLKATGDTDNVKIEISAQKITIHYYKNKPQYITLDSDAIGSGIVMNHFAKENKGVYLSFTDSGILRAFGAKYINGHNGIDITVSPDNKKLNEIKVWEEYSNEGVSYKLSQIMQDKIQVYKYKEGDLIDSFFLQRK